MAACAIPLVALGVCGAIGESCILFTVGKFGVLTTSMIAMLQKALIIAMSVTVFHPILSGMQVCIGLVVALGAIVLNWDIPSQYLVRSRTPAKGRSVADNALGECHLLLQDDEDVNSAVEVASKQVEDS
ncbi:hypothetical protein DYB28_004208 [Aphanomyces astaci]|uniref:Uncharacterized protein n=1 Tax=Aphanomyces astaci TaxID=112090 RepID=A0A397CZN4_APHAT|nr:hypothetical protein DYB25_002775 [Aphanomyces astaci]RHY11556.1 hypothetical protein DYB36_002408 [Aphanomyces astaci]RHY47888.1 hypothetical protein DYB30_002513 [Aphanomyces astaci]RHY56157.1 hypothetical protein DYB34_000461 [Aphanomyces astaci]RHY56201.1 hypothetical protein DYB38_001219 [Aphanomyces astaci]